MGLVVTAFPIYMFEGAPSGQYQCNISPGLQRPSLQKNGIAPLTGSPYRLVGAIRAVFRFVNLHRIVSFTTAGTIPARLRGSPTMTAGYREAPCGSAGLGRD